MSSVCVCVCVVVVGRSASLVMDEHRPRLFAHEFTCILVPLGFRTPCLGRIPGYSRGAGSRGPSGTDRGVELNVVLARGV